MAGFFSKFAAPFQQQSPSKMEETCSHGEDSQGKKGLFQRALSATRQAFQAPLHEFIAGQEVLDNRFYDELEESLIQTDMGLDIAVKLVDTVRSKHCKVKSEVLKYLQQECEALLAVSAKDNALKLLPEHTTIVLVAGVNGAGKTTFIGKLAHQCCQKGLSVVIGAGDTFRAAAEDQLAVWADRAGVPLIRLEKGDPAAVMHETLSFAKKHKTQVVILDTAGRLQNQMNLMAELEKINQVVQKQMPEGAMRENLLVLDASTGQNGLRQAEIFNRAIALTGVVLTKLDGTAKGGVALAIAQQYGLPIKAVGIGEKIEDLVPFDAKAYVTALLGMGEN